MKIRIVRFAGPVLLALVPMSASMAEGPGSGTAADTNDAATFEALRGVDVRMAGIAYRLTTANAALCRRIAPTPGWVIHSLGQYDPKLRDVARRVFGFDLPIAVEGVVPGAPAATAGVTANDSIVSVDGKAVATTAPADAATSNARDAALAIVAAAPADRALTVVLDRGGARRTVTIPASPGCKSNFEILLGDKMEASADGAIVQVGVRYFEKYDDDTLAVVVAHELAHNILNHRARLDAAKVSRGLFAEIGRNGRLFRRSEDDADLLGMYLIRNAGYDPQRAVAFWRDHGGDIDGGLFRSRTHRSSGARAKRIADEIARIPADAPTPYIPPILATRDEPLE
ncbi:MAG: M48 family metallopeptidase [Sphingomonas bacterium]|nr:M48 family metallopeptidase [Sphingomonas bacterium]